MKTKIFVAALALLCCAMPLAAQARTVPPAARRTVVHRGHDRVIIFPRNRVFWNVGFSFGFPFYGSYYPAYPYYYGYNPYYPGYGYGYGYYPSPYSGYGSRYYSQSPYYNRGDYYSRDRYSSGYDRSSVRRVQERLARDGYYTGEIDGIAGSRTRYAIRAYERDHGLPANGVIDQRLLSTMGLR